ncbi:MAG: endonuclease MutS2 [Chloroflexota bacterium]
MIQKYLNTLEYPKVLARLATYARFSASKALATSLQPSAFYREAQMHQDETSEARFLLSVKPDVGIGSARDVRPYLDRAARSIILAPNEFLDIRNTLVSARELERNVTKLEDKVPLLADIAYQLEETPGVISQINRVLTDAGDIKNNASPELARIRREMDITHSRLMDKLKRFVSSETYSQYLQESFITQRDGRYVVPLKSDFKGRIKGVVHDQSSSGATLFVEPLPVVEQNNALRQLQVEEDEEIRRILLALTQLVATEAKFINATVQALAHLDLIFAKARYAEAIQAYAPELIPWKEYEEDAPRISLRAARHPLLDPEEVVPIDLMLEANSSMLIITGPNTGGKTVSLKTAGVFALMAQSGLHLPAKEGSSLVVFDGVFADIGDEQSLEQSLSTFSSHMTNIVHILKHCTEQSLVIFDELGAGTDPVEGAALARSILGDLKAKRITTLVATHYAELKAYAYLTDGVSNASMEFNLETLSPTYRLRLGLPGNSNAFAIASRLGLNTTIIQSAEGMLSQDTKETETMLLQIKNELEAAKLERLRLEEERAEAEYYREKTEKQLKDIDEERRQIINQARMDAQRELETARKEIEALKRQAKAAIATAKISRKKKPDPALSQAEKEIGGIEKTLKRLEKGVVLEQAPVSQKAKPRNRKALRVGAEVSVGNFSSKGVVTAINGNNVEVQLGHFRTTVKRKEVAVLDQPEVQPTSPPAKSKKNKESSEGVVQSPGLEIDLRGQVTEEALHHLEGYLDKAYLAGLPFVRIIHGKGSGILRQAVRHSLRKQPMVKSFESGGDRDGGDGVTIAKMVKG